MLKKAECTVAIHVFFACSIVIWRSTMVATNNGPAPSAWFSTQRSQTLQSYMSSCIQCHHILDPKSFRHPWGSQRRHRMQKLLENPGSHRSFTIVESSSTPLLSPSHAPSSTAPSRASSSLAPPPMAMQTLYPPTSCASATASAAACAAADSATADAISAAAMQRFCFKHR